MELNIHEIEPVARIDYYSVMLYGVSLGSIFAKFNIPYNFGDFSEIDVTDHLDMHLRQVMYRTEFFRCTVNLIDHQVTAAELKSNYEFMPAPERSDFFARVYPSVKFECAGSELNALRKFKQFSVEDSFMNRLFWFDICKEFKVTRCDFAFDFIDHPSQPDFPVCLARYLADMQKSDILRLSTSNRRSTGLVYKIERSPKGCCCYLGAQRSPEFVRVYDKLQEQAEKVYKSYDTASWGDTCEFSGCKSWTRIELQCRREKAVKHLFTEGDAKTKMMAILRYIFENYMVCNRDHVPESFIKSYFDLSNIQKVNFVQFGELEKYASNGLISAKLDSWLDKNLKYVLLSFYKYGIDGFVERVNKALESFYASDKAYDLIRLYKLNLFVSEFLIQEQLSFDQLPGAIVDDYNRRKIGVSPSVSDPATRSYEQSDQLFLEQLGIFTKDEDQAAAVRDRLDKVGAL